MAPLVRLFALLALATTLLASPHVSRNVYSHAHRAVAHPAVHLDSRSPISPPRRRRSLNKRCIPRPANSTSAAPAATAPINVAPVPSLFTSSSPSPSSSPLSSAAADTTSSTSADTPPPTSSSPPPSTSEAPAPTSTPPPPPPPPPATTSTPPPATTSTPPPAQSPSSSGSSGEPSYMQGTQSGQGTWYQDGLGACGYTNSMSDSIVAVSESLFDSYPGYDGVNPNTNPVCGRHITVNYNGASIPVKVVDRCTGCSTLDLDMSQSAFSALANLGVGRIDITWHWS